MGIRCALTSFFSIAHGLRRGRISGEVHDPSRSFIAWAMVTINNVGKQPDEPQSPTIKGTIRSNIHNKTRNLYGQLTTIGFYKPQFMPPHEPHGSNSSLKPDAEGGRRADLHPE
jgi:hypothetical protein